MITPAAGSSIYEQIAAVLRDEIVSGALQPGQKMPSETTLEQQYQVSRITIRRATAILRNEGLVVVRRGHGGYVRDELQRQDLNVPAGTVITARMPTLAERAEHGIGEGVPVFAVTAEDGAVVVYPADRWQVRSPI